MLNVTLALVLSLVLSGCVSSLGHYQENLKVRQLTDTANLVPTYNEVKSWAYDVQDGLDTRATANHYMLQYGTLIGLAAVGTMAGLAIFSPGSDALKGIPIGAAFLSGAAAYYDNHYRYDMYSRASTLVRTLIDVSDERVMLLKNDDAGLAIEARCLKQEVGKVIDRVRKHIVLSDPNSLAAELRAINSTADQGKLADLVKAAKGDLGDLDVQDGVRETYCSETGLTPVQNPDLLILNTQKALSQFSSSLEKLAAATAAGKETALRLRKKVVDELAGKKTEEALKDAKSKIIKLAKLVEAETNTNWGAFMDAEAKTAAQRIESVKIQIGSEDSRARNASRLDLSHEQVRINRLDKEASDAAANITTAIQDAEAAVKAVP